MKEEPSLPTIRQLPRSPGFSKSMLSVSLTKTHSGYHQDFFDGEKETISRMRQRSKRDPPPTDLAKSVADESAESGYNNNSGTSGGKQKS